LYDSLSLIMSAEQISYDLDSRHRFGIRECLFIRRHSDMEKGERGRELLRKSLRGSLLKISAAVGLLIIISALTEPATETHRQTGK
jgi:hypothetical protein